MNINLIVEPRKTYSWDEFKTKKPEFSISLDGFVNDKTQREEKGPYANFDHHMDADRGSTLSTCMQVYEEINMGLFDTFRKNGIPTAHIYVNDPDEDTCLSWWELKHHELVRDHGNPRFNRLVTIEDKLDRHAGGYPLGETKFRRQMAWIFQPYNEDRFQGKISSLDATGMYTLIEAVCSRISEHIFNEGEEISLEGHYERLGGGAGWSLVKETGPASRIAMYNDGITAYARLVAQTNAGSYVYTLGRKSCWTRYNLPELYNTLNEVETEIITPANCWGGSNTIGGSPRETGSKLSPEELEKIINKVIF